MEIVIWLDDERNPYDLPWKAYLPASPITTVWVKTVEEFQDTFRKVYEGEDFWALQAVWFDNDLGQDKEGCDAFNWMEKYVRENDIPPFRLFAQTANPAARIRLQHGFWSLRKYWMNK